MNQTASPARSIAVARRALTIEAAAVTALIDRVDDNFARAVDLVLTCAGRTIVSGVGKTGHIGRKLAATLASTGTPAYFVHAAEASHGDLGMIAADDLLIALSHSGEGSELLAVVPIIKRQGARLIAMTGNPASSLAREADVHLDTSVAEEACPLNLAPTASTTAALALGDALAVALLDARGFDAHDFARSHPGGALGRRLLTHVHDVMRNAADVPCGTVDTRLTDAIIAISRGGLGLIAVLDPDGCLAGVFTDGDLRRSFEAGTDPRAATLGALMTRAPHTIDPGKLAVEAVELMQRYRINALLVVDASRRLAGALNMHDLLRAQVI